MLGRVTSNGKFGQVLMVCLSLWLENCKCWNLLPYLNFSYVLRNTEESVYTWLYRRVDIDNRWDCCVICIEMCVCAVTNEACGLVGAQPLGSKGPILNFGASSATLGSCFNRSEL